MLEPLREAPDGQMKIRATSVLKVKICQKNVMTPPAMVRTGFLPALVEVWSRHVRELYTSSPLVSSVQSLPSALYPVSQYAQHQAPAIATNPTCLPVRQTTPKYIGKGNSKKYSVGWLVVTSCFSVAVTTVLNQVLTRIVFC